MGERLLIPNHLDRAFGVTFSGKKRWNVGNLYCNTDCQTGSLYHRLLSTTMTTRGGGVDLMSIPRLS